MIHSFSFMLSRGALLFALVITGLFVTQAQKAGNPLPEMPWHIQELNHVEGNYYSPPSFRNSVLYLKKEGAVVSVQYDKDEWGAVRLNDQGKSLWQAKVKGPIVGISGEGDNVLLFYSDNEVFKHANLFLDRPGHIEKKEEYIKTIHAVLLDGKTGKQLQNKIIYINNRKVYVDARVLNREDGTFSNLLIRVSDYEKELFDDEKELKKRLASTTVSLVALDNSLNVTTNDIKTAGQDGLFVGCRPAKNGDFFFCSILDDQLIVERFNQSGTVTGKLTTQLAIRMTRILVPVTATDPMNSEFFFVGLHYINKSKDNVNQVFGFDFSASKVTASGEEELDRSYGKSLEMASIKELQNGGLNNSMPALRIVGIFAAKDKVVVVKEMQYIDFPAEKSNAIRFRNDGVVVSIYDHQWKLLKSMLLDKKFESFNPVGRSIAAKVINEKLYLIMPALKGALSYVTVYAIINIDNQQLEKFQFFSKENLSGAIHIEGDATLWFGNGALIEYLVEKGGMLKSNKDYGSIWQSVNF